MTKSHESNSSHCDLHRLVRNQELCTKTVTGRTCGVQTEEGKSNKITNNQKRHIGNVTVHDHESESGRKEETDVSEPLD